MRRFVVIGTRAISRGKLPLNDMAGGAGRMDVLVRALMSSILTSHGIRPNVEFTMILRGGTGTPRRIKFVGSELRGIHAEERSVGGKIASVLKEPIPPKGHWVKRAPGIYDGGGDLEDTLGEWNCDIIRLDANAPFLYNELPQLDSEPNNSDIGFILGDDKPLETDYGTPRSIGNEWLQGHSCITIIHFLLDNGVEINL